MKEINFAVSMTEIARKINEEQGKTGPRVQLSILPEALSSLRGNSSLETLFRRLMRFTLLKNAPGRPVRVAFCKRKTMLDMESQFALSPLFWVHARIKASGIEGFETGIKETLQDLGYHRDERIAGNISDTGLDAFYSGQDHETRLIVWIQNNKSCNKCDFLIPVTERNALQPCGIDSLNSQTSLN